MSIFRSYAASTVVIGMALLGISSTAHAKKGNSINVGAWGGIGPDVVAAAPAVEYERAVNDSISILGRLAALTYEWDDDVYLEDGDSVGVEGSFRWYPASEGLKGFFMGGSVGYWDGDWDWVDDQGTSYESRGYGNSTSVSTTFDIGGRFNLGSGTFAIIPSARIGNYFSVDDESFFADGSPAAKESEVGFFAVVGVHLGIAF